MISFFFSPPFFTCYVLFTFRFQKSTHLVTSQEGFNEGSAKVQAAKNLGLHVVSKEFVIDSIAHGVKQNESNYNFSNNVASQPLSPTSSTSPTSVPSNAPALTVTIPPTRPANSPQTSATSPRSPPGFNNLRAPNGLAAGGDKKGFGRPHLRVDVNKHPNQNNSPQPTPSPKSPLYATSESARSEEDDDDEDDEDDDENSSEDDSDQQKPSFRDVLEQSNREASKQPRAWESATPQYGMEDDGCKIFVGGIMFDDLEALKKTKDGYSASEEVIAHIQKLKNERLIEIIRIFSRFGTVVRVKQFLEKRHIFITYDNKNSALQALRALKPLEVRKKIVQEVRERLRAEDRQTLVSPRSNFYVRWPHHVESEDGGYSSASRSYFSGSSAPSSPTASSLPTHKLSWRQPQSPTAAYQPYQRSYFQNNFTPAVRSTSMRSYFSNSESEYEASNNMNSFSESESSQYSRTGRSQHYQQQPHAPHQLHRTHEPSSLSKPVLSESDSDAPTGIRHRVIDRSIDRTQDASPPSASISPPTTSHASTTATTPSPTSTQVDSTEAHPTPTSSTPTPSTTPAYTSKRRPVNEEGNWHKVLVLLLILASMAIVYLYNK